MKKLYNWILSFFKFKKEEVSGLYKYVVVSELPESPLDKVLYVEGVENIDEYWYALLKCPCGCQEKIMLNLIDDVSPCWYLRKEKSNFSIYPSIWRTKNCKSHFWLKNNKIVFVEDES